MTHLLKGIWVFFMLISEVSVKTSGKLRWYRKLIHLKDEIIHQKSLNQLKDKKNKFY